MEFERWETPFENEPIHIRKVSYPVRAQCEPLDDDDSDNFSNECLRVWVQIYDSDIFRLTFEPLVSFRLMDEIGFSHLKIPSHFYRLASVPVSEGLPLERRLSSLQLKGDDWLCPYSFEKQWRYLLLSSMECMDIFASHVTISLDETYLRDET